MTSGPWDLVLKEHAPAEVSEKRYAICKECDQLILLTKQCKKCFCIMPGKVKVNAATCPLNKW